MSTEDIETLREIVTSVECYLRYGRPIEKSLTLRQVQEIENKLKKGSLSELLSKQ